MADSAVVYSIAAAPDRSVAADALGPFQYPHWAGDHGADAAVDESAYPSCHDPAFGPLPPMYPRQYWACDHWACDHWADAAVCQSAHAAEDQAQPLDACHWAHLAEALRWDPAEALRWDGIKKVYRSQKKGYADVRPQDLNTNCYGMNGLMHPLMMALAGRMTTTTRRGNEDGATRRYSRRRMQERH